MAFNPFHSMRRNSKAILAVVTIFIMVIFVLSSGIAGGDFFNDFIPRLLGGKGNNPVYAEAFGSKIKASEVDATSSHRIAANQFMTHAKMLANNRLMRRINQQLGTPGELSPQTVEVLRDLVADRVAAFEPTRDDNPRQMVGQRYEAFRLALTSPELIDRQNPRAEMVIQQVNDFMTHRQNLAKGDNRKDYQVMLQVENIIRYEGRQVRNPLPYFPRFSSTRDGNLEDAMIFELFLKKADELGIHYPTNVVNELIQNDLVYLDPTDAAIVEQGMRKGTRIYSSDEIVKAIGNEFRVRAVVRYYVNGLTQFDRVGEVTPYEFFDFYRDNRTEMTLNLVEIPVASFLPKVTGEPTIEELKKLYDQYKTQEFNLSTETPGFREMPKMKLEWIGASANSTYYEQNAKVIDGLTRLSAGFMQPWGATPASGIAQIAAPHLWETLKMREIYQGIVTRNNETPHWDRYYFSFPHETSMTDRNTLASLVGQIGLAHDPINAMVHGPLADRVFNHVALTIEARARVAIGMPFVLSGYSPTAYNLFPALVPAAAGIPQVASLEVYSGQLREELRQGAISRLFRDDIKVFRTQLDKIRTEKKDGKAKKLEDIKKETEAYIQQFVKERGLEKQSGKSQEFRDRYTLHTDPGLKPLLDREPPPPSPVVPSPWIRAFFADLEQNATASTPGVLYDPYWFPPREIDPQMMQMMQRYGDTPEQRKSLRRAFDSPPDNPKEVGYLVWRSDYTAAKTWQKYDEAPAGVKHKVLEAWKFQKARELAKAEAERLAAEFRTLAKAELQDKSNVPAFLNSVSEKIGGYKKIELTKVSPVQEQASMNPLFARQYVEFTLPQKDIYFPGNLRTELLDLRTKPVGETVVLSDQPKGNFYVSTMVEKKEPEFGTFATNVFAHSATKAEVDPMYMSYVENASLQVLFPVIDRLKIEAGYKPTEEFKKATTKKEATEEE